MKCIYRKINALLLKPTEDGVYYANVDRLEVCSDSTIEYPVLVIAVKPNMAAVSVHVHWEVLASDISPAREVRALQVHQDVYQATLRMPLGFEAVTIRLALELRGYLDSTSYSIHLDPRRWELRVDQSTWLEEWRRGSHRREPVLLMHPAERRLMQDWEGSTQIKRGRRKMIKSSPLKAFTFDSI